MEKIIIDADRFLRTISRISHEIIEKHQDFDNVILVGVKRRGAEIAELIQRRIAELIQRRIEELNGVSLPMMELDITFYRDDLEYVEPENPTPVYSGASSYMNIQGKEVILIDDVLYTGRTIRAAIDNLVSHGRPARVSLAVLVDRGHRELPIRPDFVGKNIPTSKSEEIIVEMVELDGQDRVLIKEA